VRVQVVPDQDDRAAELLVRGIEQAGVVGLGEALAPAFGGAAVEVDAVDQPGSVAGFGADQC
jgi:Na+-translocating ferredoxin:NAD+ oxidoreductase RnfC subunit